MRNWSYRVFFLVHVTLSPLIFPLMFFHVSYLRIYLWPTIALYTTDQLLRYLLRTPATATITRLSPTLIAIHASPTHEIPLQPGTHAILRHPAISYTSHPFSITSSGPTKRIRMVARIHSGFTKKLAEGTKKELAIILDLPYGAPLFFPDLGKFEKVLFVAGGVGATFATSWVKFLMRGSESRPPPARLGQLRFVWAVRTAEDALWALQDDYTGDNAKDLARCVELYITGSGEGEEGVEMMEGLLAANGGGVDALVRAGVARERIFTGRPVLGRIIHDVARKEGGGAGTTAVLACGPKMMGSVVKRAVARLGAEGADVWLHVEEFGH